MLMLPVQEWLWQSAGCKATEPHENPNKYLRGTIAP
jgi:hypothetical protein